MEDFNTAQQRELAKKKFKVESKKRLQKTIEKKMLTIFIGALSEFERKFGFLWGDSNYNNSNGFKFEKLKAEMEKLGYGEDLWLEIWSHVREAILNNGNKQLREAKDELDTYEVEWQRYHMFLPVKPRQ